MHKSGVSQTATNVQHRCSRTRQYKSLHVFGSTVAEFANVLDRELTATDLFATALFKPISYNSKHITTAFTRQ